MKAMASKVFKISKHVIVYNCFKPDSIKTSGSESRSQEEAACMSIIRPMRPLQQVIYTDGSSKFLKCCGLAAITVIA